MADIIDSALDFLFGGRGPSRRAIRRHVSRHPTDSLGRALPKKRKRRKSRKPTHAQMKALVKSGKAKPCACKGKH